MGVILSCVSPSTTGFTLNAYNARGVSAPAGTWGYQFIAVGPV